MPQRDDGRRGEIRLISAGAAILAAAVLTDSALEHYRGSFKNPAMVLPLTASSVSVVINGSGAGGRLIRAANHVAGALLGAIGFGFHLYNIGKRPGGFRLVNAFYGAPWGAPASLVLAGAAGAIADALKRGDRKLGPVPLASGRPVAAFAALGLMGTVAEAGFLHFRGAYHDPFMWAPVVLPPVAAASLTRDARRGEASRLSTALLGATVALGFVGSGFHAWGVSRNMGGWRNWRQNLLNGPPIPAPPAFTGLALIGLAALRMMRRRDDA